VSNLSLERVFVHRPDRALRPSGRYVTASRRGNPFDRRVTYFGTARLLNLICNLEVRRKDRVEDLLRLSDANPIGLPACPNLADCGSPK
jgi:hypothetical protein